MRSIDNIMGEIVTEAAEMGLAEKLEERERKRKARVEKIIVEHGSRANEIGLGLAIRELAVALQRSEEGRDEATGALGRYRAFVRELVESGPLRVISGVAGAVCAACSNGAATAKEIVHAGDCWNERARKALEGR